MIKRIVLEHTNGLCEIGGLLDMPTFPSQVERDGVTFKLIRNQKTYVMYREADQEPQTA